MGILSKIYENKLVINYSLLVDLFKGSCFISETIVPLAVLGA